MKLLKAFYSIEEMIPSLVLEFSRATPVVVDAYTKRTTLEFGVLVLTPRDMGDEEVAGFSPVTLAADPSFGRGEITFDLATRDPIALELARQFFADLDAGTFEPRDVYPSA